MKIIPNELSFKMHSIRCIYCILAMIEKVLSLDYMISFYN